MSVNNFSSNNNPDTAVSPWWAQEQQQQQLLKINPSTGILSNSQLSWLHSQESSSMNHCNTNEDTEAETHHSHHSQQVQELHKKTMFEKPLTPSDVGKLNRLVIPKQHAEKHFPLSGDSIDKGLLLSFEDELGKSWRFRYSYWNSSQSYVLTKGWSRYVKDKGLDAGDVVFFARHRTDPDRLFIGWRRRGTAAASAPLHDGGVAVANSGGGGGGDGGWSRMMVRAGQGYPYPRHQHGHGAHVPYQSDSMHAGSVMLQQQQHHHHQTAAATTGNSSSKTLRLFGVNLECQLEESEPSTPDSSSLSSQSQGQAYHQMQQYSNNSQPYYYSTSHQSHMDINFCEDVKQTKDHRG